MSERNRFDADFEFALAILDGSFPQRQIRTALARRVLALSFAIDLLIFFADAGPTSQDPARCRDNNPSIV